ncbi:NAD-dependent epimerase/dehydratase family protein [Enterovibrio norvegicus]|uniref:NAD-dependent epimerase/dehydratase family protein n=1 Tax=Enterovibrio norvegicus TaxID=188144 RepID=UPI00352CF0EA
MRVLVTGASGFVGSQFIKYRSQNTDVIDVVALVRNTEDCEDIPGTQFRIYDGSHQSLLEALDKVDVVLHLATYYEAEHKSESIERLIESNVTFGTKLLEAMKEKGVARIVNIGTTWQKYQDTEYNYANLYAATKQAFQEILNWYSSTYDFSVLNLHLNDTYGEEDKRKKIIQLLIELAENSQQLAMSPGEQKFETCHISDVISALEVSISLVSEYSAGKNETFSILNCDCCTLKELATIIEEITNGKLNIEWGGREYRKREVMSPPYNSYDALPGWNQTISLKEGLVRMYEYKRENNI